MVALFLPGSKAERIVGNAPEGLTREGVGPFGRALWYPMRIAALRTPLVRLPNESIAFPFNLIHFPASNDVAGARDMLARNRALYDRVYDARGLLIFRERFPDVTGRPEESIRAAAAVSARCEAALRSRRHAHARLRGVLSASAWRGTLQDHGSGWRRGSANVSRSQVRSIACQRSPRRVRRRFWFGGDRVVFSTAASRSRCSFAARCSSQAT